jgi:ketosteroid isomerase-like protein
MVPVVRRVDELKAACRRRSTDVRRTCLLGAVAACSLLAGMPGRAHDAETSAAREPAAIASVWSLEEAYWRYVKAGDVESYVKLWHDDFIGWPCGQEHPKRKASIGDWVKEVRDKRISVEYELTREGDAQFGDVVVVHYSFTRVDTYPDGHVDGRGKRSKITHTWKQVGDSWQIIGGMCGNVGDTAT